MPQPVFAGTDLAQRIIELSDRVSDHSKKLTGSGFVLTTEYAAETRRLTDLCRLLKTEADQLHEEHDDA